MKIFTLIAFVMVMKIFIAVAFIAAIFIAGCEGNPTESVEENGHECPVDTVWIVVDCDDGHHGHGQGHNHGGH